MAPVVAFQVGKAGPATFMEAMGLREVNISPPAPPDIVDLNNSAGKSNDRKGTGTGDDISRAAGKRRVFWSTSVNSNFLIRGGPKLPLLYTVETLREGKSYCTRHVQVRQPSANQRPLDADVVFVATVSFKTVEPRGLETQVSPPPELRSWVTNPRRHEVSPAVDVPSWMEFTRVKKITPLYTGVEIRKVDMTAANRSRPLQEHRKYASDRNGMFAVTEPHNVSNDIIHTGSLSHTVIFHANPSYLLFRPADPSTAKNSSSNDIDDGSSPDWAVLEQFSDGASEGRGIIKGRLWSPDGILLATTMQDAVVRVRVDGESGKPGKRTQTFSEMLKSML
ncbi:hypothetical protein ABW21_db0203403 [Orbilia brochopaga]|nr:hypothetical protein ABW21_db0203403 [Drechslerella brochopaga]